MPPRRNPMHEHGGMYRPVPNLTTPWIPSPVSDLQSIQEPSRRLQRFNEPVPHTHGGTTIKRRWGFFREIKSWLRSRGKAGTNPATVTDNAIILPPIRVHPSDWKNWGYYVHPRINGVEVNNYSPESGSSANTDPHAIYDSLRSSNGTVHPENWVPGIEHPSLPRRPPLWIEPNNVPGTSLPFPSECQLNPFFEHRQYGISPLCWDIGKPTTSVLYGHPTATIPLSDPDRAQPATFPFVTHMFIMAIAEDTAPRFQWPIMVENMTGIKCQDVFDAMYRNFQQHVSRDEVLSWGQIRQEQANMAFYERIASRAGESDEMRRIDYMANMVMFRGFEPSPNNDGWVMFLGLA